MEQEIKQALENLFGRDRDDTLIRTYVPTGKPSDAVSPLDPPPFNIAPPAGQPAAGGAQSPGQAGAGTAPGEVSGSNGKPTP